MTNLLRNPTLSGFTLGRYFTEKNGSVGTIEYPTDWEFAAVPRDPDDPEKLPQSLHREQGFAISAGYRAWEGGFVQRNVPLTGGTRYMAKVGFVPHVGFPDGRVDLSGVTWRIMIETPLGTIVQDWQMTQKGSYDQYEEMYLAFDCGQNTTANFHFQARSVWAGNVCEIQVFACSLEDIAHDGTPAPMIGQSGSFTTPASAAQPVTPPAASTATPAASSPAIVAPIGQRPSDAAPVGQSSGGSGSMGGISISDDPYAQIDALVAAPDFDAIVNGLRTANQWTQDAALVAGFARLAEALMALKG